MATAIFYGSGTGNTERAAKRIGGRDYYEKTDYKCYHKLIF